ncbi:MAG: oligosaccharide flippase family protein [Sulfuricurvum sp.]|uniref:lipopolysaccharide biosynthesis protein n=1 Tax=Sulfuricurvum sp. TaxID=2025608 RepID=UPI0035677432
MNRLKPKSEFGRNVLTLMTGTTIAQAIPIAVSPILTRIYTPEDFGLFALYMSIASIGAVIATGRYDLALMLPKKDEDALWLLTASGIISFGISLFSLIIVFLFNDQITTLLGNPNISDWLYFIPLSILFSGLYQSLNSWANRKKAYKTMSNNRMTQSTITAGVNVGAGFGHLPISGLIVGGVSGLLVSTLLLARKTYREIRHYLPLKGWLKMKILMKKYINFPKYDIAATLSNVMSYQITYVLFNSISSGATAGHYYLVQKVLGLPTSIVAASIQQVFKEKAISDFNVFGNAKVLYINILKKLLFLAVPPFLFLFFYAQEIFVLFFGQNWAIAGHYAQILTPMFFLQFIASPLSYILYITKSQRLNLYTQIIMLLSVLGSFACGYLFNNIDLVIILISLSMSFIYLFYILISYIKSKGT